MFSNTVQGEHSAILLTFIKPFVIKNFRERGGSVVECLTRDRGAAGSSLTGITALWYLSKTHSDPLVEPLKPLETFNLVAIL